MRETMDQYALFDKELKACHKCEVILASSPVDPCVSETCVEPRPIVSGIRSKPILLIGQAPGITEYNTVKPFQGKAGQKIREIFREVGVADFDELVYSSAVVKCYPGRKFRKLGKPDSCSEDRMPSTQMVKNCRPFLERQLALVNPQVIVILGSFPLKAYLQIANQKISRPTLGNFVGKSELWNNRLVVFFPHTSGGAYWLNSLENKKLFNTAKQLLRIGLFERSITHA
jgi:uracil-DNA glycosylase